MRIDFNLVHDLDDFALVPPGRHLCRVADVRESTTQSGDPYWAIRLEIVEGEQAGVTAGWDNLVFSERGKRRARFVLDSLGFETRGVVEIESGDLLGRTVLATFVLEEREDPIAGRTTRLRVPWAGYEPAPADGAASMGRAAG